MFLAEGGLKGVNGLLSAVTGGEACSIRLGNTQFIRSCDAALSAIWISEPQAEMLKRVACASPTSTNASTKSATITSRSVNLSSMTGARSLVGRWSLTPLDPRPTTSLGVLGGLDNKAASSERHLGWMIIGFRADLATKWHEICLRINGGQRKLVTEVGRWMHVTLHRFGSL